MYNELHCVVLLLTIYKVLFSEEARSVVNKR